MIIEKHNYKDNRIEIDLEENEFLLIAHLIEKSVQKSKNIAFKDAINKNMHKIIQEFLNDNY